MNFTAPDVIITQNMLIYYRVETRHLILQKLAAMLPIGGYLLTGPAEDGNWNPLGLKRLPNHLLNLFVRVA
ncbi:CheR methyltransferase, SAM binding domain [compost metagenome]